jgi:mRNA-degrading endonuclease YafQ of YafQ-DinJ toxin-antitoxin module
MEKVLLEIHQTRRFAKRLVAMAKAGKHERIVAERARQIIADLQINPLHEEAECKRTLHGELRLNDCRKYDLSCGFRLIALKREKKLIFTYVGSHDDCQRWIENNRYYQDTIQSTAIPLVSTKKRSLHCALPLIDDQSPQDEYEEQIRTKIDEQVLRSIFAGLCKIV